jgi:ABC-2 type transport system permease protein
MRSVKNILAIYLKEIRSYFVSPVAYVVAAFFLLVTGYMFRQLMVTFNYQCMIYTQQAARFGGQMPPLNINDAVVTNFFGVRYFIWLIVMPMLTMRLIAEEKKMGTMELLMTSPITTVETILGKFFACFSLYAAIEALGLTYLLLLGTYGNPDWGPILTAYVSVLLMGAVFVAVGMVASAVTENQIIAVVIALCTLLLFWLIDWAASFAGPTTSQILRGISVIEHMRDSMRGLIDTKDVIFFLSFTVFSLFLTHRVVESQRWRG